VQIAVRAQVCALTRGRWLRALAYVRRAAFISPSAAWRSSTISDPSRVARRMLRRNLAEAIRRLSKPVPRPVRPDSAGEVPEALRIDRGAADAKVARHASILARACSPETVADVISSGRLFSRQNARCPETYSKRPWAVDEAHLDQDSVVGPIGIHMRSGAAAMRQSAGQRGRLRSMRAASLSRSLRTGIRSASGA
jgi:hypothetical protein